MGSIKGRIARVRVPAGGIVALAVVLFAHPTRLSMLSGIAVTLAGEAVRIWASGYIRKNTRLATDGPYGYTRNPLYVGNLLIGLGVVIAAGNPWMALLFALYYAVCYGATIRCESEVLARLFGDEFERYRTEVPGFFPRLRATGESGGGFDRRLIWQNREYRAIAAVVAVYCLIALRSLLRWP
ncbi:MAG: isoprenylcysteine carboxylmethyltransferase family protein [Acidobacteria bacterium]|nr:isoprenylcysteine carboxylmethyltransferase family protein [Acidobacteriota bacterium]